jgi:hypothetical protein
MNLGSTACPGPFRAALAVFLFLLAPVPFLHGSGRGEDPVAEIDALIEGKRYDEAVGALALYMREYPGDLDRAQERMRRIAGIQSRYNSLVNRALDLTAGEEGDGEEILALSREIGDLSPGNRRAGEFLARLRDFARSGADRKRLEALAALGGELCRAGDYPGALRAYREGVEFCREGFFARNPGEEGPAREQFSRLSAAAGRFEDSLAALDRAGEELRGASPEALVQAYRRLKPELAAFREIQGEIGGAGAFFSGGDSPGGKGDLFFSSVSRFIYGWDGQGDGMLRALEACLEERIPDQEALLRAAAGESYGQALSKAREGRYGEAAADYEEALRGGGLVRDYLETALAFQEGEGSPGRFQAGILVLRFRDSVIARSGEAAALALRLEDLAAEAPEPSSPEAGKEFGAGLEALSAGAEALEAELRRSEEEARRGLEALGPGFEAQGEEITRYAGDVLELLAGFRSRGAALEQDRAGRFYGALNAELRGRLESREKELAQALRLMEGLSREEAILNPATEELSLDLPPGEALYFYPREARGLLEELAAKTGEDLLYANTVLARYEDSAGPAALREDARKTAEALEEILRRGAGEAGLADQRFKEAEDLRIQGDHYYREAQEAAGEGDFTRARDFIQRAAERYGQSLSIQEFPSLREEWDTRMLALGQEIIQGEYEAVVKEVRDALNQVRSDYLAGNFQQAENALLRGQNRWQAAAVEENPEISYWLSMVREAITLRSGKEIPATAPLFAEMSQLLSDARRAGEEGAALIGAGRREEGMALFDSARQKLRDLKLVFPENREAGMLELRMDQVSDPAAFNASFRLRLEEALGGIRNRTGRAGEAFTELQNLAELNPSYPGIRGILEQAEIDMGYRPAPPDPGKIRRSEELTRAARVITEAGDRELFPAALRQLDEALILDPGNTQAMILKDQVHTRMGTGNALLSSFDEEEYQKAVRELQRGNTLISMSIVNQLLQNPRNRGSTRILELQRRIQSLL